jgi:hypothetical protein
MKLKSAIALDNVEANASRVPALESRGLDRIQKVF